MKTGTVFCFPSFVALFDGFTVKCKKHSSLKNSSCKILRSGHLSGSRTELLSRRGVPEDLDLECLALSIF